MIVIDASERETPEAVARACAAIVRGGIVAFPTETFYGLGVKYDDAAALERLCTMKRRPGAKAIPLIIGGTDRLPLVAPSVDPLLLKMARRFWPGPLTILAEARDDLSPFITAGTGRVAVRVPGPSFALSIARALPFPVTATSANVSGMPPAVTPQEVIAYFGDALDLLVDGGRTPGGRPSTIIELAGGRVRLLRDGVIAYDEIMKAVDDHSAGSLPVP